MLYHHHKPSNQPNRNITMASVAVAAVTAVVRYNKHGATISSFALTFGAYFAAEAAFEAIGGFFTPDSSRTSPHHSRDNSHHNDGTCPPLTTRRLTARARKHQQQLQQHEWRPSTLLTRKGLETIYE